MTGTVHRVLAVVAVVAATVGVGSVNSTPVEAVTPIETVRECALYPDTSVPPTVIALGDSYSSGEGLGCYMDSTDRAANRCHRSPYAFSAFISASLPHRFVACSGAVLANVLSVSQWPAGNQPPQIDAVSKSASVVTLTIGANDAHFGDVLKACLSVQGSMSTAAGAVTSRFAYVTPLAGGVPGGCAGILQRSSNFVVDPSKNGLKAKLISTYRQLLSRMGRNARLVVGVYPQIIPPAYTGTSGFGGTFCEVGRLRSLVAPLTYGEVRFGFRAEDGQNLRPLQAAINAAIRSAVAGVYATGDTRIRLASTLFAKNDLSCGPTPRTNGYVKGVTFTSGEVPSLLACLAKVACRTSKSQLGTEAAQVVNRSSFHPTVAGQAAMGAAFAARASGAATLSIVRPLATFQVKAGLPMTYSLVAVGGTGTHTWSATGLPPGLTISTAGVISGKPSTAGVYQPVVTVRDSSNVTATRIIGFTIIENICSVSAFPTAATLNAAWETILGRYRTTPLSFFSADVGGGLFIYFPDPSTGLQVPVAMPGTLDPSCDFLVRDSVTLSRAGEPGASYTLDGGNLAGSPTYMTELRGTGGFLTGGTFVPIEIVVGVVACPRAGGDCNAFEVHRAPTAEEITLFSFTLPQL